MTAIRDRLQAEGGFSLVELLVVMFIFAMVGTAITGVLLTTQRSEQYQRRLQDVMDDGRVSIDRIRQELRAARRVLHTTCETTSECEPSDRLHFWVDQNQDALIQDEEVVCYIVGNAFETSPNRYRLLRWTGATDGEPGSNPCTTTAIAAASETILAETLIDRTCVDPESGATRPSSPCPFQDLDPVPVDDPDAAPTRDVHVVLVLEVPGDRGPDSTTFEATIRLRNVE